MEPWDTLRVLRQKDGQTVRGLAEKAELSPGYLCDLENGKRPRPTAQVIRRLATALNVPMSVLEPPRALGPEPQAAGEPTAAGAVA